MKFTLFYLLATLSALSAVQAGEYRVARDEAKAVPQNWGPYCGSPEGTDRSAAGQTVEVSFQGGHWLAWGAGRAFGSQRCEGQNLSLKEVKRQGNATEGSFKCVSERVAQGTEESAHRFRQENGGERLFFDSVNVRSFRKGGELCVVEVRRNTALVRLATPLTDVSAPTQNAEALASPVEKVSSATKTKVDGARPAQPANCNVVNEPARLVRKSMKKPVLYRGLRHCFLVEAQDRNGCRVDWAPIKWKVIPASLGKISRRGCLKIPQNSPTNKGKVIARLKGKRKTVRFTVEDEPPPASEELVRNEALDQVPGADVRSPLDAGVVAPDEDAQLAAAKGAGPTTNTLRPASPSQGLPLWSGGALLLLGLIVWGLMAWRGRDTKPVWQKEKLVETVELLETASENDSGASVLQRERVFKRPQWTVVRARVRPNRATGTLKPSKHKPFRAGTASTIGPASERLICRKCDFSVPAGHRGTCPMDGAMLEPVTPLVPKRIHRFEVRKRICPTCCSEFDPEVIQCPFDETHLLPDIGQWDDIKQQITERNAAVQNAVTPKAS